MLLIAGGVRRPDDQLVLAKLQRQIAEQGLQARVRITGYLEENELSPNLNACDVLIYPNTHTDFSYSVYLGLAYQTAPVVLSDIESHRELTTEGVVAFFSSNKSEALAQTIRNVVENPTWRTDLMEKAQTFVQQNTWASVARRTRDIYQHILQP
ncbi:MAG: glycosyltransferase [Anaerolineales bacterium]|nr:glycosyltransferase [Anaerolineales bacterium]